MKVELSIAYRLRERRIMLGLRQEELARRIGVTYQQLHKYERGINRISAGRLSALATALGVPIGYFYEEVARPSDERLDRRQRLTCETVRNLNAITDPSVHEALHQLARALAAQPAETSQDHDRQDASRIG